MGTRGTAALLRPGRHHRATVRVSEREPQFFWGFFAVAVAWQIGFLTIGSHPVRFRPLMMPAILEKVGFVATLVALFAAGRISTLDLQGALPDGVLAVLFAAAFAATRPRNA